MFKNFNLNGDIIPLLMLNSTEMNEQRYRHAYDTFNMVIDYFHRDAEPYPIAWLQNYGAGRVFYNAMGHREDVWQTRFVCNYHIWFFTVICKHFSFLFLRVDPLIINNRFMSEY